MHPHDQKKTFLSGYCVIFKSRKKYFVDIEVDAEEGGSFQCEHNDDGEQVDYEIQLITWDYEIYEFNEV